MNPNIQISKLASVYIYVHVALSTKTAIFLLYWVFVVQPHKTVSSQESLIKKLVNTPDFFPNADKTLVVGTRFAYILGHTITE